ncbi:MULTISPECIES: LacI family DNA-binding transcriptional regulator [Pseudomonas]|jgi:LacI family gluconate utilization system Gnt-I transcriptional repressor|uniref:LacI family DNA-binding transcriptional regulator n=1 Tax=Pseudomonas TaxID=286 RepID=UPI0008872E4D|nr:MULTISPECIES: LacI family DNA-binding transcriptional regulator [Pseudomonas]PZP07616.1 MAG: LacI family DNA-binding transcriptional regulator [Pseudomonas protegens]UVM11330.1 LacI family DNA-binding transcriptional regulator [Pseudomonas protegens]SDA32585.1 transcriptional regulator, LacI family [Pseudomonas sp. NFPP12]SEM30432.1 transcriptional regulator, LacI family [Pseudomonas sp. NFPP10]SFK10659.1 transcriptional regulator, LacI family [Pseudomonas sp. NFPP08]
MSSDQAPGRKRRGAGRVTLNTVARQAGVSAITVSRYFNQPDSVSPERRERIAAVVAELGYVPNLVAGGLASARGRIVAMVIPNISGPIFAQTIQGFSDTLSRHGYQLLLASSYFDARQEESAVRAFLGWSPAALVLTSHFHSPGTEKMLADTEIPVIETWDYQPQRQPLQIGFSHFQVGVTAARHLHAKGYRRIAFVQNSAPGDFSALERRDGYLATLAELGLAPRVFAPDADRAPFEAGKQAMEALMGSPERPDAIIFANDNLAAGGLLAGQRAGLKIPEECAVLGFGDYPFAQMLLPSLSTIQPPALQIGVLAATRVLESLGVLPVEGTVQRLNLLQCRLIERESS